MCRFNMKERCTESFTDYFFVNRILNVASILSPNAFRFIGQHTATITPKAMIFAMTPVVTHLMCLRGFLTHTRDWTNPLRWTTYTEKHIITDFTPSSKAYCCLWWGWVAWPFGLAILLTYSNRKMRKWCKNSGKALCERWPWRKKNESHDQADANVTKTTLKSALNQGVSKLRSLLGSKLASLEHGQVRRAHVHAYFASLRTCYCEGDLLWCAEKSKGENNHGGQQGSGAPVFFLLRCDSQWQHDELFVCRARSWSRCISCIAIF